MRDPRASILENDPFTKNKDAVRPFNPHKLPRNTQESPLFQRFWEVSMNQSVVHHKGNLWHFSKEEKHHLLLAVGAFSIAIAFMSAGGIFGLLTGDFIAGIVEMLVHTPIFILAIAPAFVLHEIGHKIVAKYYGCWAEFRADPQGLQTGILISAILGFIFMSPGAVMVAGMVSKKQNGHIAIAGPLVNLFLFIIGIPLGILLFSLMGIVDPHTPLTSSGLSLKGVAYMLVTWWLGVNAFLGLFNMIPWGPLDGLKVKGWSEEYFWLTISVFGILVYAHFTGYTMGIILSISEIFSS
jgi:Zn-dependent protease